MTSPLPGRSILMTSAPIQASSCVHTGPAWTWVMSTTRTPSRALFISVSPYLYIVWFMVPGANAFWSIQTLISEGLPDSRARSSAGRMSFGSRTSSP